MYRGGAVIVSDSHVSLFEKKAKKIQNKPVVFALVLTGGKFQSKFKVWGWRGRMQLWTLKSWIMAETTHCTHASWACASVECDMMSQGSWTFKPFLPTTSKLIWVLVLRVVWRICQSCKGNNSVSTKGLHAIDLLSHEWICFRKKRNSLSTSFWYVTCTIG